MLAGRVAALETWWHDLGEADRAAALRALSAVGCAGLVGRPMATLSLGERARVLIARALVGEPALLLFDEPAAGLDLPARERLLQAMRAASTREGLVASIVTTHHLEEIPATTSHAALLRDGVAVTMGPVQDALATEPLSACFGMRIEVDRREGRWSARAG